MTKDDIEIINLSGDVESLTERLAAMTQRAEAAEAQLVIATRTIKLADENAELRVAQVIKRAKAAEAALAKAQDDGRALNCMLDETLQELADALAEIISLRRSEGHNADRAIGRLQALRPDSEYLRQ